MSEQFLTRQELAATLKVAISTVDMYYKEGMPAAIKYPPRFVMADVVVWLNKRAEEKGFGKKDKPEG